MCLRFLSTLLSFLRSTFAQHPFNFCRVNAGQMLKPFKWTFISAVSNRAEDVDWKWTYSFEFREWRMCLRFLATLHFNFINGRWVFSPQTAQIQSCLFSRGRLRNVRSFQRHSLSYFLLISLLFCHVLVTVTRSWFLQSYLVLTLSNIILFLEGNCFVIKTNKKALVLYKY